MIKRLFNKLTGEEIRYIGGFDSRVHAKGGLGALLGSKVAGADDWGKLEEAEEEDDVSPSDEEGDDVLAPTPYLHDLLAGGGVGSDIYYKFWDDDEEFPILEKLGRQSTILLRHVREDYPMFKIRKKVRKKKKKPVLKKRKKTKPKTKKKPIKRKKKRND